ncbi:GntR family transcriptional regulator [Phreatobacter aquaticus]|uniref:GntR family transcriptional regulator n=1 Tax=Phreatobacter aquaticus TaxID=2570229 RepID=A0A4D7QMM0_9HYPH|nr:GntR family transcriptional regulator [Phreatobacter aquaticus]QCK86534.1 GntR family transcriptional regulator [Phreatobacter aquaticus]
MNEHPLIARRSLATELTERLRDMIVEGTLAAGSKISEPDLCETFGVSRTPLREALKVLAAEGLVQLTPNRGATVARIEPGAIEELFPIMGMLEALAGELACARLTDRDLRKLEAMHGRMVTHWKAGEWVPYSRLNREIHEQIFVLAGNQTLAGLYQSLMVKIHAVRFVARKSPERWAEAIDDHERMMVALRARDGAGLSSLMREHLRHKADVVHEALRQLDR